jgi:hypothetical protein
LGHSHLECDKPLICNSEGKLPYDVQQLVVQDTRKKKLQSFSEAAAGTFGSTTSSSSKQPSGQVNPQETTRSEDHPGEPGRGEDVEVSSPLKQTNARGSEGVAMNEALGKSSLPANRKLF